MVDALLADKTFSPRAVTRNASSEAARQLAARGVEVVTGDLWDKESIKQALTGCEGVFGVSELSYSSNGWYSNCRRSQTIMILAS